MESPYDHATRMERVRLSVDGLSVGDAFGERFFDIRAAIRIRERQTPRGRWRWTDDTAMALSICEVLDRCGGIDQDALAVAFARRYRAEPMRGYGGMAQRILADIYNGTPWQAASSRVFRGQGSMGNGSAMRVAPVGAYFADDLDAAIEHARLSAEVTHWHREGQAGAIAIAAAAAFAWNAREAPDASAPELLSFVHQHTPAGETCDRIARAMGVPPATEPFEAARILGSGHEVTAQDTVPFTLWCAARHLDSYAEALWCTVAGLGDRDTTCAIVGGIVVLSAGRESIPTEWLAAREALPTPHYA